MSDGNTPHGSGIAPTRRSFVKATSAAALASAGTVGAEERSEPDVDRLLDSLSLREKAGQMTQITLDTLDPEALPEVLTDPGVGSVLNGAATPPTFDPAELVAGVNDLQRHVVEETDHGIPFVYGLDAVHGNATVDGATAFPHGIGVGATRDVDAARAIGGIASRSLEAVGAHWAFSPVADVLRDPRWGRFYEGVSEDPTLTGEMARATVEAIEDQDGRTGACVKHFAGYSAPRGGADRNPADVSMRELRDAHFPAFRRALAAEPETLMVNSGSVNGVPAHASTWLLTSVLRERWGYDGLVISDWKDFSRMVDLHEYVPTLREATRRAIAAGVDVYMNPDDPGEFVDLVVDLVESGELARERVDDAARRVLQFKANLGLLEDPYLDEDRHEDAVGAGDEVAQRVARRSMTLLENGSVDDEPALPLSDDPGTLLLTGPGTDSVRMQMGGWTLGWQSVGEGYEIQSGPRATTIHEAVTDAVADGTEVRHEPTGREFSAWWDGVGFSFENEDAVADAAADADAVVLALGEAPHAEGLGDRQGLELPEPQRRIVETVAEAAPDDATLVGVLYAGGPRGTAETFEQLDAVLMAYQPGTAGGPAVADVIFGETNPSGKLPFAWPETVGQLPAPHDARPPRNEGEPRYAFGYGLSYTEFEHEELSLSPARVDDPSEQPVVTAELTVANVGDRAGEHVVDVFATESYGSVLHPDRRRLGSARVDLEPGESERVAIDLPLVALEVTPGDVPGTLEQVVEPGEYRIEAGDASATLTVEREGSVSGQGPIARLDDVNDDGRVDGHDLRALMTHLFSGGNDGNGRGRGKGRKKGHGNGRGNGRGSDREDGRGWGNGHR